MTEVVAAFWLERGVMGGVIVLLLIAVVCLWRDGKKDKSCIVDLTRESLGSINDIATAVKGWREDINLREEIRRMGRGKE